MIPVYKLGLKVSCYMLGLIKLSAIVLYYLQQHVSVFTEYFQTPKKTRFCLFLSVMPTEKFKLLDEPTKSQQTGLTPCTQRSRDLLFFTFHQGCHPSRNKTLRSNSTLSLCDIFITLRLKYELIFSPVKWGF